MKKLKNISLLVVFWCCLPIYLQAQYTKQDSLRGSLTAQRTCFDVTYYDLQIRLNTDERSIKGSNTISYKVVADFDKIQLDLFENLQIEKVLFNEQSLPYRREGNAFFVTFPEKQQKGKTGKIEVLYSGTPKQAANAPWDGGFVWKKDKNKNTWFGIACEGIGASLWFPCKDHLSDEPDNGVRIACEVPKDLVCVSNGNLYEEKELTDGYKRYDWRVSYPINNYNITLNVAYYQHFSEVYTAQDGSKMPLDYYVLPENFAKAQQQFKQVKPMLECYEKLFGKYPFWKDGFAMVDTPYLGMEHQGAVAYGNRYLQGYAGTDLTKTGIQMLFDFIIIHESGHEYFGNSISAQDHAEMWIHEAFTSYAEALYVECMFGKAKYIEYANGYRKLVAHDKPLLAPLGVNAENTGDIYWKGHLMLHTFRSSLNNDALFFKLLYDLVQNFQYKTTNTYEIVAFINQYTKKNYTPFFNQYLRYLQEPTFEYKIQKQTLTYRWLADEKDFEMPLIIHINGKEQLILPTQKWKSLKIPKDAEINVAEELFYINVRKIPSQN